MSLESDHSWHIQLEREKKYSLNKNMWTWSLDEGLLGSRSTPYTLEIGGTTESYGPGKYEKNEAVS